MKLKERLMKLREDIKNKADSISKEDKEMIEQFNNYILGAEKIENFISNTNFFDEKFMHCTHFSDEKIYRYTLPNEKYKKEFLGSPMIVDLMYKELDTKRICNKTQDCLQKNNLNLEKYIDIEFFEYMNLENSFDMSGNLADLGEAVDIKDYKEFRELVAEGKLYFEKEKIHFKFAKCSNQQNQIIYIPLYIGVGTNEPLGFQEKDIRGMKRWYKVDVENDTPFQSKGILKQNNRKSEGTIFKSEGYGYLDKNSIQETYDFTDNTVIVCALNPNVEDFNILKPSKIFQGFCMFKEINVKGEKEYRMVGEVTPEYEENFENFNLEEYIKIILQDPKKYLIDLSNCIDKEYMKFFSVKWHPYKILSNYGCIELFKNLSDKYQATHAKDELKELYHCCIGGNVHTIVGDIDRLKSYTERLKYANLIFSSLLKSGNFFEILNEI